MTTPALMALRKNLAVHGLKLEIRNWGKMKQKHEGQISNFQFQRSFERLQK
ncbi:MAG: hypothetical protein IMF19_10055 [Proteobacteria bacterium]|nr:hypothetical protein [Pseudomonadota bacterium]